MQPTETCSPRLRVRRSSVVFTLGLLLAGIRLSPAQMPRDADPFFMSALRSGIVDSARIGLPGDRLFARDSASAFLLFQIGLRNIPRDSLFMPICPGSTGSAGRSMTLPMGYQVQTAVRSRGTMATSSLLVVKRCKSVVMGKVKDEKQTFEWNFRPLRGNLWKLVRVQKRAAR